MFPCTPLMYSLDALCSFLIYILFFTDKKKNYLLNSETTQSQNDASCVTESFNLEWELAFVQIGGCCPCSSMPVISWCQNPA